MPHGRHIYVTEAYMAMDKMCAYPPYQHAFPYFKCVLLCCSNCPCIDLSYQESDRYRSNTYTSIRFHIYHLISHFTVHGRRPVNESKFCSLCLQDPSTVPPLKLYTRKELVMMETSIADFHTSFYIPAIKKLALHLPYVRILGTNHCGNTFHEEFKRRRKNQDMLYRRGYSERAVAIFSHQI